MGRYLTAKVLSILLASCYVFATPTPAGPSIELEELLLPITKKVTSKGLALGLEGLEWSVLQLQGTPVFDTYHVVATGLKDFFADLSIDRTNKILIADKLCNKQSECDKHMTDLVKAFLAEKDIKIKLDYLAINNIQEDNTVPILAAIAEVQHDGYLKKESPHYLTLTKGTPLGRLGMSKKVGSPVEAVYIGNLAVSIEINKNPTLGLSGGSSMIFFYTTPPSAETIKKGIKKASNNAGVGSSRLNYAPGIVPFQGGNAAFEEARRKERVQAQQQQANRTPGPSGASSSDGCTCSTTKCSCSAMKRDSFPNNSRFKRAVEECPPCCAAAC